MKHRQDCETASEVLDRILPMKPQIFQGSYGRWYVRCGKRTPEDHCPSFHTEEMARAWVDWSEE